MWRAARVPEKALCITFLPFQYQFCSNVSVIVLNSLEKFYLDNFEY